MRLCEKSQSSPCAVLPHFCRPSPCTRGGSDDSSGDAEVERDGADSVTGSTSHRNESRHASVASSQSTASAWFPNSSQRKPSQNPTDHIPAMVGGDEVKESDANWMLAQMQSGRMLTTLDCIKEHGILRPAARVCDLRKRGHEVITTMIEGEDRYGDKCRYAGYHLKGVALK